MSEPEQRNSADTDAENTDPKEPELIIDTDWKEQVAKEKSAASQRKPNDAPIATSDDADPTVVENPAEQDYPPPPPASFDVLVSMLFTQAMSMLGQMPGPSSEAPAVNKPYAKHYIDTLDMLGEKTKGNLSEDESKILSEALHALRMMYVNAKT